MTGRKTKDERRMATSSFVLRPAGTLGGRYGRRGVVVHVSLAGVVLLLLLEAVVVAVGQLGVIVLVSVPVGAVLPLAEQAPFFVMVGDMIVVVAMGHRRVGVGRLPPFAFRMLRCLRGRSGRTHDFALWPIHRCHGYASLRVPSHLCAVGAPEYGLLILCIVAPCGLLGA